MTSRERWQRLRNVDPDPAKQIDDELRYHIEGRIEQHIAEGMDPAEARELTYATFGNLDDITAECLRASSAPNSAPHHTPRVELMDSILKDLRYALRGLAKRPVFTTAVIVTLVLAIGATTSVFSVVNGVLLQPLPHPDPDQLVQIHEVDARPGSFTDRNAVSVANFGDWRDQNRTFEQIAAFNHWHITHRGDGDPERVFAGFVSTEFFSIVGVQPHLGRTFVEGEDAPGADRVVILGYNFWQSRYGADSAIVGEAITLGSSTAYTVVAPGAAPTSAVPDADRF